MILREQTSVKTKVCLWHFVFEGRLLLLDATVCRTVWLRAANAKTRLI